MIFAARLRYLRRSRKLAQVEIADYLNVARSTYSSWESNKAEPDIRTIELICRFFDVSSDFLLGIETHRSAPEIDEARIELWQLIAEADDQLAVAMLNLIKRLK